MYILQVPRDLYCTCMSCAGTVSWDDSEDGEREEAGGKLSASSVHSEEMLSKSDGETESNAKRPEGTCTSKCTLYMYMY